MQHSMFSIRMLSTNSGNRKCTHGKQLRYSPCDELGHKIISNKFHDVLRSYMLDIDKLRIIILQRTRINQLINQSIDQSIERCEMSI